MFFYYFVHFSKYLIEAFKISLHILNEKQKLKKMFYRYKRLKWNGENNLYNYLRTTKP